MGRHKAREAALKILYSLEVGRKNMDDVLEETAEVQGTDPQWEYSKKLVQKVHSSLADIDSEISRFARDWPIFRMAVLDRNILRMAVAEMLYFPDIPPEVAIDEAVELAKTYGDAHSGEFINGILANIHRHLVTLGNG